MKKILLSILILISLSSFAQKSSPISGNASELIDLLFIDYNSGNQETKLEDIAKNRSKVISIFKSYKNKIDSNFEIKNPKKITYTIKSEIEELKGLKKITKPTADDVKKIKELESKLNQNDSNYYDSLYKYDKEQLNILKNHFHTLENMYLCEIIAKFIDKYELVHYNKFDIYSKNNTSNFIQKSLPFSGGNILVDGIDGLSRFLAKRIKEELTLNAIQNIREYLENKDKKDYLYELEAVLPVTVDYLKNYEAEEVLKFSNDIKQYIEEDFKNLLKNSARLKNTPRVIRAIEKHPDLDFAFEGLEILDQVTKIKSPVDYFEIIGNSRNLERWKLDSNTSKKNIAESLQLASMLAYSLTHIENGEVKFVTTDFISSYGSQSEFVYLYFGFLHQQNLKYFSLKHSKTDYLTSFVKDTLKIKKAEEFIKFHLVPVVKNAERLHNQLIEIKRINKNKEQEKLDYDNVYQLINDLLSFAEEISISSDNFMEQFEVKFENDLKMTSLLKPYFNVAHLANDISLDLHEKRYTNAITKSLVIPSLINPINNYSMTNLNITIESFNTLKPITDVLTINSSLEEDEIKMILDKNKISLEIIRLKYSNIDNLKNVSNSIGTFLEDINLDNYNSKKTALIQSLRNNKDEIINYLGLSENKIKLVSKLEELVKEKNISLVTKEFIINKYVYFENQAFNKYLIGEPENIESDKELKELYAAFVPELLANESIKSNQNLVKFIQFINNIAYSNSPEEYQKAIEVYVLPTGSSSLKEKTNFYYSINSFPGILGGIEISDNFDNAFFFGFTAPVGLYFQPWSNFKNKSTLGIFIPIIDIGAPVRLRLDNSNDTKTLPDFEFKDIFSPGFYLVYGFGKSPFALNLGLQYGPKLRDLPTDSNTSFESIDSFRIGLGITIDIPLLTLGANFKN